MQKKLRSRWLLSLTRAPHRQNSYGAPTPRPYLSISMYLSIKCDPPPRSPAGRTMASLLVTSSVRSKSDRVGTFQVKIEQTETQTKTQTETEKTTVVEAPTAGQRAVGFRTLAIIGVAAACGLQVPVSYPRCMMHLCTHLCTLQLLPVHCVPPWALDHACSTGRVACVPAPRAPAPSTRGSRPTQARLPKLASLRAAPFRRSGCQCSWLLTSLA